MLEYELEQEREEENGEMLPTILVGGDRHGGEEVAQGVSEEWQWCPATARAPGDKLLWRRGGGASRRWQCPFDR
jgi:hypothetical protein